MQIVSVVLLLFKVLFLSLAFAKTLDVELR
jgi:hypothetical protein